MFSLGRGIRFGFRGTLTYLLDFPSDWPNNQHRQVKNDDVSARGNLVGIVGVCIWPEKYREQFYLPGTSAASSAVPGLRCVVVGRVNNVLL